MGRRAGRRAGRRGGRRAARRTTRRVVRRRRRRRVMVGGMVLLAVGGAAAYKLSKNDADRIEQHTGTSVEELTDEELTAAMSDLNIQSADLTDEDRAALASDADAAMAAADASRGSSGILAAL